MAVIMVGHSLPNLQHRSDPFGFRLLLLVMAMGTPGFAMVSGMLLGYIHELRENKPAIRRTYWRRAAILAPCHVAIAALLYGPMGAHIRFWTFLARRWYITDSLVVYFLFAPALLARLQISTRFLIAILCFVLGRAFYLVGLLSHGPLRVLAECLGGVDPATPAQTLIDVYALLPIFGYFIFGSCLGKLFADTQRDMLDAYCRRILKIAGIALLLSAIALCAWLAVRFNLNQDKNALLPLALYPTRGSSLFGLYAAIIIALAITLIKRLEIDGRMALLDRFFVRLGQTSLFTYLFQYALVLDAPYLLGWAGKMTLAEYLLFMAGSFPLTYFAASLYSACWKPRSSTPHTK